MDRIKLMSGARLLLEGLGVDPQDHNFFDTPRRVADVYEELFTPEETGWPVFAEDYTDIVIVKGHTFYTLCPHHLLPVKVEASVAYFPDGKVIGLSKLCRLIHEANRMPCTQEKLTSLICDAIRNYTEGTSRGEAVLLKGDHDCMRMRGVRSQADMLTYKFKGCFEAGEKAAENQRRFLDLVNHG